METRILIYINIFICVYGKQTKIGLDSRILFNGEDGYAGCAIEKRSIHFTGNDKHHNMTCNCHHDHVSVIGVPNLLFSITAERWR